MQKDEVQPYFKGHAEPAPLSDILNTEWHFFNKLNNHKGKTAWNGIYALSLATGGYSSS